MSLLNEILEGLPEERIAVAEVRMGPFLTTVRLNGMRPNTGEPLPRCGLASTLARHQQGDSHQIRNTGRLTGLDSVELANYLLSDRTPEASLGMATVNALSDAPESCMGGKVSVPELLLSKGRGRRVAIIGHFPFVDKLRSEVEDLFVLELNPSEGDLPADCADEVLPTCQAVALSATVLMNGTYEKILPLCRDAFTVMLGPSAPPLPLLFDYGVDALAGSLITDPEDILASVSQGSTYRDLKGVKKWLWRKDQTI